MSAKTIKFSLARGKPAARRSIVIACGVVCNAVVLSFMATSAKAQATPYTWTSSSGGNWSVGTNWQGGTPPAVDPAGKVNLDFNAPGTYASNNNLGPFQVYNTTFDTTNGATTLNGGDLNLSWPLPFNQFPNNPTFTNNSTAPLVVNNNMNFMAPAGVGGTVEYFSMIPGSTATFNGTVNLTGGSGFLMVNGASSGTGGPGGTMIWTQPVVFTNNPATGFGGYFPFRVYEGTFEIGGYTIANGTSNNPVINVAGVNVLQTTNPADGTIEFGPNAGTPGAPNNGAVTDMYIGPEDIENGHPNDVVAFDLIANGNSMNQPVQVGDAGSITIGGVNTSGTVTYNDFFKTLPSNGNGTINGVSQTIFYSAAAGGTVLQNFQLIRGGGSGFCGASVNKIGPGTWIVAAGGTNDSGEQAYHGNTTVRDGTLELAYDDTGTAIVTLPDAAIAAGQPYYSSGLDGGSLGFNDPSNAVQLGDSGTLPTDTIALLTLVGASSGPRQVLHMINVNNNNSSGTTTIGVGDSGTANFSGAIALAKGVILTGGTGGTANFSAPISGAGGVTVSGTGTVNLSTTNNYSGGTTISSGLLVAGNGFASVGSGAVTVNGGSAIFRSTTAALVFGKLKVGFNAGAGYWNGPGFNSATAASNTRHLTTLGMLQPTSATTFTGQPLGTTDVAVKYTYYGDADLSGTVTGADYHQLDLGFGAHLTGWQNGDFNYDGVINGTDYALIDNTFNQIAATGASPLAIIASDADLIASPSATSSVPEPTVLGLLGISAAALLGRRRRNLP